jgi:hypothetical protein
MVMKKTLVFVAFAALAFTGAKAQGPIGGDHILELSFTPLGNSPISMSGISYQMYLSEDMAICLGLNIASTTNNTVIDQPNTLPEAVSKDDQLNPELLQIDKTFAFEIEPGIIKVMTATDNLIPFFGLKMDIGMGSSSGETEMWGPNDIDNVADYEKYVKWSQTYTDKWSRFGIAAVAGFNYYFVDNLYLGAKFSLGWSKMNYKDTVFSTSDDVAYSLYVSGFTDDNVDLPPNWINGDMSAFMPRANATLCLGWIFKQ